MSSWFSPLLFLLAGSSDNELRKQVEFLKAENELLRKRVPRKRIVLAKHERERLLKLGEALGSAVAQPITIVHPRTYQRWRQQQRSEATPASKATGRPRTQEAIRKAVLRMARETSWGYRRIVGELKKLGVRSVSAGTVRNILLEAGLRPGPTRGGGTWAEFLRVHAETLWQVDFFAKPVLTPRGVRQAYVLAFLHVKSRQVFCSPASVNPTGEWVAEQATSLLEHARGQGLPVGQVIRDRDGKYQGGFGEVMAAAGVAVIPTAPKTPNQNAYAERWVRSIKLECLGRFICFGTRHLDYLVGEYTGYYNELRPHQSLKNRPLQGVWPDEEILFTDGDQIECHSQLGGVLKHYCRKAA